MLLRRTNIPPLDKEIRDDKILKLNNETTYKKNELIY